MYKKIIIGALVVVVGVFLFWKFTKKPEPIPEIPKVVSTEPVHEVIGKSVQGRNIDAYTYGTGNKKVVFVGGVHGGYEWNTSVLAYKFMDYLHANPKIVPEAVTVVVIPDANPDGVYKITGKEGSFGENDIPENITTVPGRFNANDVDLNRNFDCKWQPKSKWQNKTVSAGSKPFSEPEALALKDFIEKNKPSVVIFWHSQGGEVYASQCQNGILPETLDIMNVYAKASGYGANPTYDAYETTGDADSWLAKIGLPAITVELKTHTSIEWEQNLSGIKAILNYYK